LGIRREVKELKKHICSIGIILKNPKNLIVISLGKSSDEII